MGKILCDSTLCEDCSYQDSINLDTVDYVTILGGSYVNPYSIAAMTQAYNEINNSNILNITTTHYYIKVKPQNGSDLRKLDSLGLELFDYPLDRIILKEGQY